MKRYFAFLKRYSVIFLLIVAVLSVQGVAAAKGNGGETAEAGTAEKETSEKETSKEETLKEETSKKKPARQKPVSRVSLNRTKVTILNGKNFALKASVFPENARNPEVKWSSSNKKVAIVNGKGRVKVVGTGTAQITARTANGKKAVCVVTSLQYFTSGEYISISTPDGIKSYRMYSQCRYSGYIRSVGCVHTGVATIAFSYGLNYTPDQIHFGSSSSSYSEKYALRRMGASSSLYGSAAISVSTASQILTDMGISNRMVFRWSDTNAAIREITAHVMQGKPVLLKANNRNVGGIRVANGHHTMVLVGIDEDGYGIFIDPWKGTLNYAHGSGRYFKMSVSKFVYDHMTRPSSGSTGAYVTSLSNSGGYILVG